MKWRFALFRTFSPLTGWYQNCRSLRKPPLWWLAPYGRRSAPAGPESTSGSRYTQHQTLRKTLTPARTCTLRTMFTGKQRGSVWMCSDICSVPVADGEPIRPPAASATLHLPAPPLHLHPGTHGSWHLEHVETVFKTHMFNTHVKEKHIKGLF